GRALGIHLVLATQRPAGVIRDSIRANTDLRIALRVSDASDSIDVIGAPAAAALDPEVPGRALVRAGPGAAVAVQAAFPGARSGGAQRPPSIRLAPLGFAGRPSD